MKRRDTGVGDVGKREREERGRERKEGRRGQE